jgi:ribosomal protein S18 acetylase RimI-like enzyme
MKKIIIRKPHHEEYAIWSGIYRIYLKFYQTPLTEEELQKVWLWISEPPHQLNCYFAEVDAKVVGLAHFREYIRPLRASSGIYLDDLIVLPEFQGHGIGYELIAAIKVYAKENNASLIRWMTAHDNKQAMKLYDSVATKTTWVTYDAKIE